MGDKKLILRTTWKYDENTEGEEYIPLSEILEIFRQEGEMAQDSRPDIYIATVERIGRDPARNYDALLKGNMNNFSLAYNDHGYYDDGCPADGLRGKSIYERDGEAWTCTWHSEEKAKGSDVGECKVLEENDGDERPSRTVIRALRDGQFRNLILAADGSACVITGETQREVLEAAHIVEVRSKGREERKNGITLRRNIHTLWDRHLFRINPDGKIEPGSGLNENYKSMLQGDLYSKKEDLKARRLREIRVSLENRMKQRKGHA